MLYFGIPANERLLGMWDTIEDRLLKIRSSLDLAGRPRTLFPPGLSLGGGLPAGLQRQTQPGPLMFQAQSAGLPLPAHRFTFMMQKAYEFAGEVRAFGTALLAAAEKRDAEQLARLRTSHEVGMLHAMQRIRELQIEEAEYALTAARQGREGARIRKSYYINREFISAAETAREALFLVASGLQTVSGVQEFGAAVMNALPNVLFGAGGHGNSPHVSVSYGSTQLAGTLAAAARGFSVLASAAQTASSMAGSLAGYQRRQEEWDHQARLAENDIEQFEQQIAGATTRLEIARRELENQEKQLTNANEIAAYMQQKFTNEELYEWMLAQAAEMHFHSYLLAVDVARRAEECFRYERMRPEDGFVSPEQWDDLNALLAGERLQHDLRRMEKVYLDQNTREYEITKHISLAQVDPTALILLRQNGECFVSLPEHVFDADHHGQSDVGLFEANLRDERYLPFEGAGAISMWRIELPNRTNRFDPATIVDVVLHMR